MTLRVSRREEEEKVEKERGLENMCVEWTLECIRKNLGEINSVLLLWPGHLLKSM